MEWVLLAVVIVLLVDRFFLVRGHRQDLERSGAYDAKVIDFAESVVEKHQHQVSEMATRIQHPEVIRPDITLPDEPSEPLEPDEYEQVGAIIPGEPEDNSGGE